MTTSLKTNTNKTENSEFAVLALAGKQYIVSVGDLLTVDKPFDNFKAGDKIVFESVLFYDNGQEAKVGNPSLAGAKIEAIFVEEGKSDKVLVWRFRAKSRYSRKYGHRQPFTTLKIASILV